MLEFDKCIECASSYLSPASAPDRGTIERCMTRLLMGQVQPGHSP